MASYPMSGFDGTPNRPRPARPPSSDPSPRADATTGPACTQADFDALRTIVHGVSGIFLSHAKKALLVSRLNKRLRALDLSTYADYREYLAAHPDELTHLVDSISTNETQFFREPQQFDHLATVLCPAWRRRAESGERHKHFRIWSAACSTGEEAYSAAMAVLDELPAAQGFTLDVLATDISTVVLGKAIRGLWPIGKSAQIPPDKLARYMLRGTEEQSGLMAAGNELRQVVRFRRMNLIEGPYPSEKDFDLILCRNVLIYFDPPTRANVVAHVLEHLDQDGRLYLGHAESVHPFGLPMTREGPSIYAKAPASRGSTRL